MDFDSATDPVFISYRHRDGSEITAELVWLLRAAGIPVWRDRDDLPPGDTEQRLHQAISDGIAGGVLVVTDDVANSEIVKYVEAPRLLELHSKDESFALGIVNAVQHDPGHLDYTAPDRLLGQRPGTFTSIDQQRSDRPGLHGLVQRLLWHRIANQRDVVAKNASTLQLSVQTRNTPQVYDRTGSQLDIRIRPSNHERLPSTAGLVDLKDTIGLVPDVVTRSGAQRVLIRGGAHLSVALALGAALPSSRVGHVEVVDQRGDHWVSGSEPHIGSLPRLKVVAESVLAPSATLERPAVAVYVDLLPQRSDAAFVRFLSENAHTITAWRHLASRSDDLLEPSDAGAIAAEAAARIRAISNDNSNATVHLFSRCPFPIAVLVGRLTNTIRTVVYEWDDSTAASGDDVRPGYVPALRVRASAAGGVITEVMLPCE